MPWWLVWGSLLSLPKQLDILEIIGRVFSSCARNSTTTWHLVDEEVAGMSNDLLICIFLESFLLFADHLHEPPNKDPHGTKLLTHFVV